MVLFQKLSGRTLAAALPVLLVASALGGCSSDDGENEGDGGSGGAGGEGAGGEGGAAEPASPDWTQLGYDGQSTYNNRGETMISVESAPNLEVAWEKDLFTNVYSAPLMVGDIVYTANGATLFALNADTGDIIWEKGGLGGANGAMAYADGTLYLHDANGMVHGINADNGEELWLTDPDEQEGHLGFSSVLLTGDLIVVGGSGLQEVVPGVPTLRGFASAIDRNTGERRWRTYNVPEGQTGASLWSSLSVDPQGEHILAATGNNYTPPATDTSDAFLSYDITDGAIVWKNQRTADDTFSLGGGGGGPDADFGANPIVFQAELDGTMTWLVGGAQKNGDASVVRLDDGSLVWTRNLGPGSADGRSGVFNNGAWDGTNLLFACNGATSDAAGSEPKADAAANTSVLFALEPATGNIVWERQLKGQVMAPITVANGVGFVGADSELQAFNTATGEILFRHDVGATIACPATISKGRVAVGNGLSWSFGTPAPAPGTTFTMLKLP